MTPDEARKAMMSMYGGHDDAAVAEMSGSGRGGDQLDGPGIRDTADFHHRARSPFVDRIEPAPKGSITGDIAVLLMPDGSTQEVPASKLPPGTHEGAYLGPDSMDDLLGAKGENERLRGKLSAGDAGGDLKL